MTVQHTVVRERRILTRIQSCLRQRIDSYADCRFRSVIKLSVHFTSEFLWVAFALLAVGMLVWAWSLRRQLQGQVAERRHELAERREVEQALRASEAYFRDATEAASDWIWETDSSFRFTNLSRRFYALTGIQPEQVLGRTRWEVAGADDSSSVWQQHRKLLESQSSFQDFVYVSWLGGRQHYFKISGKPIYDDQGQFCGYRGVGTDITEQLRAEEDRTQMRLYLRNIIDSMPSVLVVVDERGGITEWNRAAETLAGVAWEQARGRFFADVFPRLAAQWPSVRMAITQRRPPRSQRLKENIQDVMHHFDITIYPLVAGEMRGAVVKVDDVTAQIRIQEMMVQTEKMLSIGGLAAGMAHEINNPLGAILQSCQNIQRRIAPDLAKNREVAATLGLDLEQLRRYLEQRDILRFLAGIQEAGTRAAKIVSDMLTFSRHSEPHLDYANLKDILETALRLAASDYDLKKKYDFKQISIQRDYDPGLERIYCDKTEIEQVILNLVKNAAQAMAESTVPQPAITLRTRLESRYARIEVCDNGPGMDERTRKRVFEPFFTTKEVGVGTGLGLSVSYFIVTEQHRGSLAVNSEPGATCFTIRLPLRE